MGRNHTPSDTSGALARRARFYYHTAGWLFMDLCRQYWGSMLLLLLASAAAAVGRIATFAGLVGGLTHLISSDPTSASLPLPGFDLLPALSIPILGGALFVVATIAAVSRLFEARITVRLGQRYAQLAMERVVDALARGHHGLLPEDRETGETTQLRRLVGGDALILVRAVQSITGLVFPLSLLLASVAAALFLSWPLTAAFLLISPLYGLIFVRLNRRVARASDRRDRQAPAFRRATTSVTNALALPQFASRIGHHLGHEHVYSRRASQRLGNLEDLLMNRYRVQFLNSTLIAVAILLIFAYIALLGSPDTADLARFAMFAVALRFGSTAANGVSTALAGFSRFLPQFQSYVAFYRSIPDSALPSPSPEGRAPRAIGPLSNPPDLGQTELELGKGRIIFVCDHHALSPQRLPIWWRILTGEPLRPDVFLIPQPGELPDIPLVHLLTGNTSPTASQRREALHWLADTGNLDMSFIKTIFATTWSKARRTLGPQAQAVVAARSVLFDQPAWIAINAPTWNRLPTDLRADLSTRPTNDLFIVGPSNSPSLEDADKAIMLEGTDITFIGDPQHCPSLGETHSSPSTSPSPTATEDEEDDDLLDA